MRPLQSIVVAAAAVCFLLNVLALFGTQFTRTSRETVKKSVDTAANCPCTCREDISAQKSPPLTASYPTPQDIRIEPSGARQYYRYRTREQVQATAESRFALLDDFVSSPKNICAAAAAEESASLGVWPSNATGVPPRPDGVVLMWIHSAAAHFERRAVARSLWASRALYRSLGAPVVPVFAIGLTHNASVDDRVRDEIAEHGDIVLLNFKDVYHNVTYKAVGGMRWVTKHCPQATVFLKVDDDTLVIPHRLARWIKVARVDRDRLTIRALYIFVKLRKAGKGSKWHITAQEWPLRFFSKKSAPGLAYFLSADLLPYMYKAMKAVPWVWLEDVWITGSLVQALTEAGVPVRPITTEPITVHRYEYIKDKLGEQFKTKDTAFVGEMPPSHAAYASVLKAASL